MNETMDNKLSWLQVLAGVLVLGAVLLLGAYFIPWQNINWGKVELGQARTVTVSGEAETQQKSQIARFTAGVNSVEDNKDEAVAQVNAKIRQLIEAVKNFGIKAEDIQTQNLNVYQSEEQYWQDGRQKSRPGQWRVSNNIEIILREVDKASALADLLAKSGATNVYGPNFSLDDTQKAEDALLVEAIANARKKAEIIAQASKAKLGKVVNVSEGASSRMPPEFKMMAGAGGGGVPLEPGSGTVSKTVAVTFELE